MSTDDELEKAAVRTRGAIRTRHQRELLGPEVRPPKGAVRTRGRASPSSSQGPEQVATVNGLLHQLRKDVGDMPLVIVVHGSESGSSREFVRQLVPELYTDDAVWLIASDHTAPAPSPGIGVELNLTHDTDARVYRGLVADLLFFPATGEAERLASWRSRVRALVVDGRGPFLKPLIDQGHDMDVVTFRWRGGIDVVET